MSEVYFSGDLSRTLHDAKTPQGIEALDRIKAAFPWFNPDQYLTVSDAVHHELLGESVATAFLPTVATNTMFGPQYILSARKFCMDTRRSFVRLYRPFDGEQPSWLPASAKVMFIGENHQEFGRPFPDSANTFYDLYLSGDCDEMEFAFDLPKRRGKYETLYGITVQNGKPARVKQYIYDEQDGFSDWDVLWLMCMKKKAKALSN